MAGPNIGRVVKSNFFCESHHYWNWDWNCKKLWISPISPKCFLFLSFDIIHIWYLHDVYMIYMIYMVFTWYFPCFFCNLHIQKNQTNLPENRKKFSPAGLAGLAFYNSEYRWLCISSAKLDKTSTSTLVLALKCE